jgi:hypothetical protein
MSQEVLDFPVNNSICEAHGCFEEATAKIKVKVGQLGSISVDLCSNCVKKFDIIWSLLDRFEPLSNTGPIISGVVQK